MRVSFLANGRKVIVPDNDLEEQVVAALMASLCNDSAEKQRLLRDAVYDGAGLFRVYEPDRFYWLEQVAEARFALIAEDE